MEHFPTFPTEPIRHTFENLLTFPSAVFSDAREKTPSKRRDVHTRLHLQEKEAELQKLQSTLAVRSAELQEKEKQLSERWDAGRICTIPITAISANPYQPRREFDDITLFSLANSIREHGLLQPLTVRRTVSSADAAEYQLIAGERRLRAAASIGMTEVPCIILDADNRRTAELALIENLQRENLNMFEQAAAIAALIDIHAMTQEEIARTLSLSQSCIANKLRLLRLTTEEREIILCSHLTERHARAFLRLKDLDVRRKTVQTVSEQGLNVAHTEEYVDALLSQSPFPSGIPQTAVTASPETTKPIGTHPRKKCILKDLRLFFNTIEHAVTAVREAGFGADSIRTETEDSVTVTVTIRTGHNTVSGTARSTAQS